MISSNEPLDLNRVPEVRDDFEFSLNINILNSLTPSPWAFNLNSLLQ